MKVHLAQAPNGDATMTINLEPAKAQELVDDLSAAIDALDHDEKHESSGRLERFRQLLTHELGHLVRPVTRGELPPRCAADMSLNSPVADPFTGTFKGIPLQHVEWALKVYKSAGTATLRSNPVLERVFSKGEAEAKEFFTRTQNVWNMRVTAGEAKAYEVILGVQDARKHKKKGSFREVDNVLCTGGVK